MGSKGTGPGTSQDWPSEALLDMTVTPVNLWLHNLLFLYYICPVHKYG